MAVCPFCGNEVEDYDVMCGKCGKTLTPTGLDSNIASTINNIGNSGAYNPYGSSNAGGNSGYNPYGSSNAGGSSGYNPYGNNAGSSYNSSQGSIGGISIESNGSYNPYGSSIGSTSSADEGYNPYGNSTGSTPSAGGGYNPYGSSNAGSGVQIGSSYSSSQGSTGGISIESNGSYNPYGSNAGSTSSAGGGYNPYGSNTGSTSSAGGGYNPYGSNTGSTSSAGGGYNPYGSDDYKNKERERRSIERKNSYPAYENEAPSKYSAYNSALDTSKSGDKVRKQKNKNQFSRLLKGIIIVAILAAVVVYGYPTGKNFLYKQYYSVVQKSVTAAEKNDVEALAKIMAFDYNKLLNDFYGDTYSQALTVLQQNSAKSDQELKNKYGDNYKIKAYINSVSNLSGEAKNEAIQKAENEYLLMFSLINKEVNFDNYFKRNDVTQMRRIKVTAEIKGSIGSGKEKYIVDLVKFENSDWKLLEIYEAD